jgi:hypothetical protein
MEASLPKRRGFGKTIGELGVANGIFMGGEKAGCIYGEDRVKGVGLHAESNVALACENLRE